MAVLVFLWERKYDKVTQVTLFLTTIPRIPAAMLAGRSVHDSVT